MFVTLDSNARLFLEEINVTETEFCELIDSNYENRSIKKVIDLSDDHVRVFRIFTNAKGYTIVSLTGIEGILIVQGESAKFHSIPHNLFDGCCLADVRKTIDGSPDAPIPFKELLKRMHIM